MQREFLQYAKKSLDKDGVKYTFEYTPREGDGRVLGQRIKIKGLTKDLQQKGYYLTMYSDKEGNKVLCQPPYHSKMFGHIPGEQFPWIKEYTPKEVNELIIGVLFEEICSERRSYDVFSIDDDIQDGDIIVYSNVDDERMIKRKITSINATPENLLIASITPL